MKKLYFLKWELLNHNFKKIRRLLMNYERQLRFLIKNRVKYSYPLRIQGHFPRDFVLNMYMHNCFASSTPWFNMINV